MYVFFKTHCVYCSQSYPEIIVHFRTIISELFIEHNGIRSFALILGSEQYLVIIADTYFKAKRVINFVDKIMIVDQFMFLMIN